MEAFFEKNGKLFGFQKNSYFHRVDGVCYSGHSNMYCFEGFGVLKHWLPFFCLKQWNDTICNKERFLMRKETSIFV